MQTVLGASRSFYSIDHSTPPEKEQTADTQAQTPFATHLLVRVSRLGRLYTPVLGLTLPDPLPEKNFLGPVRAVDLAGESGLLLTADINFISSSVEHVAVSGKAEAAQAKAGQEVAMATG